VTGVAVHRTAAVAVPHGRLGTHHARHRHHRHHALRVHLVHVRHGHAPHARSRHGHVLALHLALHLALVRHLHHLVLRHPHHGRLAPPRHLPRHHQAVEEEGGTATEPMDAVVATDADATDRASCLERKNSPPPIFF